MGERSEDVHGCRTRCHARLRGTLAYLLVDRGFTGKMNIRGATGNAATKYSARDAETVRSLDNWRPGKGTGRLKKKLLDPPPTERLWLDLPPSDAVQRKAQRDAKIVKSNLQAVSRKEKSSR